MTDLHNVTDVQRGIVTGEKAVGLQLNFLTVSHDDNFGWIGAEVFGCDEGCGDCELTVPRYDWFANLPHDRDGWLTGLLHLHQGLLSADEVGGALLRLRLRLAHATWSGNGEGGFRLVSETILSGEDGLFEEVEGGPRTLEEVTLEDQLIGTAGGDLGDLSVVTPEAGAQVHSAPQHRDSQGMLVH